MPEKLKTTATELDFSAQAANAIALLGTADPTHAVGYVDGHCNRAASCIIVIPSGSTSAAARVYRISNKSNTSCEHCCTI